MKAGCETTPLPKACSVLHFQCWWLQCGEKLPVDRDLAAGRSLLRAGVSARARLLPHSLPPWAPLPATSVCGSICCKVTGHGVPVLPLLCPPLPSPPALFSSPLFSTAPGSASDSGRLLGRVGKRCFRPPWGFLLHPCCFFAYLESALVPWFSSTPQNLLSPGSLSSPSRRSGTAVGHLLSQTGLRPPGSSRSKSKSCRDPRWTSVSSREEREHR